MQSINSLPSPHSLSQLGGAHQPKAGLSTRASPAQPACAAVELLVSTQLLPCVTGVALCLSVWAQSMGVRFNVLLASYETVLKDKGELKKLQFEVRDKVNCVWSLVMLGCCQGL